MGVRLYTPMLGRFLQVDPVPGGSSNDYDYAGQDPINTFDLDGRCFICGASEWAAGFGDTITFGGTKQIRRLINHGLNGEDGDMVDHSSVFYGWGGIGGGFASLLPAGGGGVRFGRFAWSRIAKRLGGRGIGFGNFLRVAHHGPHSPMPNLKAGRRVLSGG